MKRWLYLVSALSGGALLVRGLTVVLGSTEPTIRDLGMMTLLLWVSLANLIEAGKP